MAKLQRPAKAGWRTKKTMVCLTEVCGKEEILQNSFLPTRKPSTFAAVFDKLSTAGFF
jgi:hypothetical protein